jgi:hypothetical protein
VDIEEAVRLVMGDSIAAALRTELDPPFERHVASRWKAGEVLERNHMNRSCKARSEGFLPSPTGRNEMRDG